MATARKGGRTRSKIQALLYGEQFTGKSTLALQLMYLTREDGKPFRVLYLDAENGSVDDYMEELENDGIDLDNLYIVYTQSLKEVNEYIQKATLKEEFYELDEEGNETDDVVLDADGKPFIPDAIVVDGTSVLNLSVKQGLVEFSKRRNKVKADAAQLVGDERFVKIEGSGMELKDYNTVNFKGQDLVLTLTGSGLHYVITAREADEKERVKNKKGEFESVATGRKIPDGFKQMGYNVKTEMRVYVEDGVYKAHVVKDRTKTYQKDEIVEDPSLLAFQAVIDKTKGNKDVVVQNRLHDAIKKELKETEREVLGEENFNEPVKKELFDPTIMVNEIDSKMKAMSTKEKNEAKVKLKEKGLPCTPSGLKAVVNEETLNQILEAIK